ncbi:phage major capsid protein [Lacticaseibacillus nasuensis]|uniref:phage major capsid protein n=1 Tax=Lacticaseibacillus nasuensis TaxID=944671 RepID=UPI002246F34C|nr:phage major capsid protein [Lacticaseibacillus nasuensis]MCX2455628.1 phage major capsid protein [Lacticaseibacillus nasuensis]
MNINELNDAWVAAGQKVADLNAKINNMVMDENSTEEDITAAKSDRDNARSRRDTLKEQVENARAEEVANMKDVKPVAGAEKDLKKSFVKDFVGMMKGDPKVLNLVTSSTDESGNAIGLTIPDDVQTAIHQLKRQFDSLEQYVNVENVSTPAGSRVYETFSAVTPLADLDDESATIGDNDDPKLHLIKYLIHRYAGITTVTNTLLADTAENILTWLEQWIAKKDVVTRNIKIISALAGLKNKKTIANFDDIKDLVNLGVDPAIKGSSSFITNTSGFAALAKVKDAEGRYLVQPVVTQPDLSQIDGKVIHVVADQALANGKDGAMPLYFGDFKEAITLFDRQNMSLVTTNIGGGAFETDTTKVRVIDRFDVQLVDDEAAVAGSFAAIADQGATPKA